MINYVPKLGEIYVNGVYVGYRDLETGVFTPDSTEAFVQDKWCEIGYSVYTDGTNSYQLPFFGYDYVRGPQLGPIIIEGQEIGERKDEATTDGGLFFPGTGFENWSLVADVPVPGNTELLVANNLAVYNITDGRWQTVT